MPGSNTSSSFIPRGPSGAQFSKAKSTKRVYLLAYISYVIFFGTLISVALIYFYGFSVDRSLAEAKASLKAEQDKFSTTDVQSVRRVAKRLLIADKLINEKTAASLIFTDLEKVVADNVQFVDFSYERNPNNELEIALTGQADDFNKAIYQRDLLNSSAILKNAEISTYDYSLGQDESTTSGDVVILFTFSDTLSSVELPYTANTPTSDDSFSDVENTTENQTSNLESLPPNSTFETDSSIDNSTDGEPDSTGDFDNSNNIN